MADRFVTVPDSLELPAAVLVPIARLSDAGTAGRALLDAETTADGRTALGLGGAAVLNVGAGAGDVKAGDYQPAAADISDATAAGRGLLTAVDAEAQRNGLGLGKRYVDPPVKPVLRTYPEALRPTYRVLFHTGSTYYACLQSAAGTLYKSTDNGATWTALAGALGYEPSTLLRVAGTGTLIAIGANPTPTLKRSTDDGATWATIAGVLNYAPLGDRGLTATPTGYIIVGEYGNVGTTAYRIRRSTDDGQTWATVLSSPGTDAASDPGHFHSITWDHIQSRFVAVMDRGVQEHYYSDDEGATWTKIPGAGGVAANWPNFVAPMYFPDYIVWGYDNPNGTRIARLPRADFYSGAWGNPETVADIAPKACYDVFPLTADTWALCTSTERIGVAAAIPAAYATEIYVVYDGGSRVTGGLSHAVPAVKFNTMGGHRARFPNRPYAELDHAGQSWLNLPTTAIPYPYASVPYTVATAELMPTTTQAPHGPLITHQGVGIWNRGADGVLRNELVHASGFMSLKNALSTIYPELRFLDSSSTGVASFYFSNVVHTAFVAASGANRIQLYDGVHIRMGTTDATAPQIHAGAGSPEGVKTAPPGSMFLRTDGGAGTSHYVKESGTGNTGWIAK